MTSKTTLTFIAAGVACSVLSVAAIMLSARVFGPLPLTISQTTTNKQSTFDVTGESEVNVVPDNAQITLGISISKPKVAEAQTQVNQIINDVSAQLKQMGIEGKDIKTQNYSVYPNYDYNSGTPRTTGYNVNSSLRVDVKNFDQINSIIDMATGVGVTEVGGVTFSLSEEKEAEVKKQARREAIDKAKTNAEELSSLAGMRLGKIVNIYEDNLTPYMPGMYDSKRLMVEDAGALNQATNIEAGSSSYTYSVTLSYESL